MLRVLNTYDETNNIELLDLAEFVNNKLLEIEQNDINTINKLQIIKRKRNLASEGKELLYTIKDNSEDFSIQLAISILLENLSDCERYIAKFSKDDLINFSKYPIAKFLNKNITEKYFETM